MIPLQLLVCLALVPAMVVAEKSYGFGGCGDFTAYMDGNAATQQGTNMLGTFFSAPIRTFMWDPATAEEDQSCIAMMIDLGQGVFVYNANNGDVSYGGTVSYITSPSARLELKGDMPLGVLGANSDGVANWYPFYISETDVVFITCRNTFLLARTETIYVMTNQMYAGVDPGCAMTAVTDVINRDVVAVTSNATGSATCQL